MLLNMSFGGLEQAAESEKVDAGGALTFMPKA